jgi:hypothetical protein
MVHVQATSASVRPKEDDLLAKADVRFPTDQLSAETSSRAAEGVVAYTAICEKD